MTASSLKIGIFQQLPGAVKAFPFDGLRSDGGPDGPTVMFSLQKHVILDIDMRSEM
jgi:hypothetical protein